MSGAALVSAGVGGKPGQPARSYEMARLHLGAVQDTKEIYTHTYCLLVYYCCHQLKTYKNLLKHHLVANSRHNVRTQLLPVKTQESSGQVWQVVPSPETARVEGRRGARRVRPQSAQDSVAVI